MRKSDSLHTLYHELMRTSWTGLSIRFVIHFKQKLFAGSPVPAYESESTMVEPTNRAMCCSSSVARALTDSPKIQQIFDKEATD